ncbi:hypothetical protein HanOQP8_Chr10g0369121 [Helianthus annuus]|nr:hypothetical protein HanHA89_Chr01g0008031 [Helianthus annuus]KAJ0700554.1 hypothetical protein HanOQP8_Chr10g0369121 [Helianthus annuus]
MTLQISLSGSPDKASPLKTHFFLSLSSLFFLGKNQREAPNFSIVILATSLDSKMLSNRHQ